MGEVSAVTQNEIDDSTTTTPRERCVSDSNVELKKYDSKKMNGNSKHGDTRRRNFGHTFGKRLRLILRPWKWRRKSKRNRYLGSTSSSQSQRSVSIVEERKTSESKDERNTSKMSYSTNDLSNLTPMDVKFTMDLNEPDKPSIENNGNITSDNNKDSNIITTNEPNKNMNGNVPQLTPSVQTAEADSDKNKTTTDSTDSDAIPENEHEERPPPPYPTIQVSPQSSVIPTAVKDKDDEEDSGEENDDESPPPPIPPRGASISYDAQQDGDDQYSDDSDETPIRYRDDSDEEEENENHVVTGLASKVKRTDSLALKLGARPSREELEGKNIIPTQTDDEKHALRSKVNTNLVRRLSQRPTKEELEQRNIYRSTTDEENHKQNLEETKRQLSRKLSRRPTIKELRKKKIIGFNEYVEVFEVQEYDRRADKPWTRLTPKDKASIRKELNEFKEFEMDVHDDSKKYTRFHRP